MTQQQLQYAYWERDRRQTIYRQYLAKLQKIQNIRNYIIGGGDPTKNPDMKDDFAILWAESDGAYFIFDDNMGLNATLIRDEERILN